MVELGAVVYAALAVSVEGGVRVVFWAIEQWRRDRERHRLELINEVRNEVLDEIAEMARQRPQSDVFALVDAARTPQGR